MTIPDLLAQTALYGVLPMLAAIWIDVGRINRRGE